MRKPIAIGMSPNTRSEDIRLSMQLLFSPLKYRMGSSPRALEVWFEQFFRSFHAISFVTARSGLYALLNVMGVGEDDEIILQGFTCIVVSNSITSLGAKPVYVDISSSLTMNPKLLEGAITKKTKAIIVQHTFGIPSDMEKIMKIANANNIPVIEDVAHSLGGEYKGKKLGSIGNASIFSFGRDKAFSSTFGGMVITNDSELGTKLKEYHQHLDTPHAPWVALQLFYPIATWLILSTYRFASFGKVLHKLFASLHLLSLPVSIAERKGIFLESDVKKMPNALAQLALLQVQKIETYNQRREEIVGTYLKMVKELSLETVPFTIKNLLRFPLLVDDPNDIRSFFAKHQVYLGDWYTHAVDPRDVSLSKAGYVVGSCPKSEKVCLSMVNLPTYPTMSDEDVRNITYLMKEYVRN